MKQIKCQNFICSPCNFICSKKSNYNKHLLTAKHKKALNETCSEVTDEDFQCASCMQYFSSRTTLWRHRKKCQKNAALHNDPTTIPNCNDESSYFLNILKQNSDFKDLILEQNKLIQQQHDSIKQLVAKEPSTQNNYNTITNNNQNFNLNFFLNTTCKDAINMSEFIENMNVQFEDIENIGRDGYVTGMTNMILSRIKNLEVTKRPMHCTDLKRETIYIKDNNVWEKDNDNTKLHSMIQCIAHKNYAILPAWRDKNPDCLDSDTSKFDFCIKMMTNLLGDAGEGQVRLDNKVIRNLSKHINVDKNSNV